MTIRFDLVGIIVSDMARSLAFYRRLGLDIPAAADSEPHVEVTVANGMRLAWDTEEVIRSFDPAWTAPADGAHRLTLDFACDSPAEVDATYAALTAAGAAGHIPPFDAFWGQRYAAVADPDGDVIDLFAPLGHVQ
jgi:catechol 2,3-dioxygenase-like lactoylglutathione lyase family enzyme